MSELWGHTKAHSFRALRWAYVIVVLALCVNGLLRNDFEVCKVETVTTKDGPTVTKTCSAPSVTDAGVVAMALLIVLVLTPDMSEVGIFGLSLKTRLRATEEKAKQLESQLQMQNLRVDTLSQNLNSASAQGIGQLIIATPDQIRQVDSDMAEKVKAFNWDVAVEELLPRLRPNTFANEPPKPNSTLESRIIQNWETIAASLNLPPKRRGPSSERSRVSLTPNQIERFRFLFEEEIQIVRAARNNVAHAVPIEEDALRAAVDISDRLLEILNNPPPD